MKYSSTRGLQKNLSYNDVLLQGLARDGGLDGGGTNPSSSCGG